MHATKTESGSLKNNLVTKHVGTGTFWDTAAANCFFFIFLASAQQGEVESGTKRKVKRLLSFQRYCHNSRLLRGLVPHTPGSLHLLDDDYLGQAAVRTHPRTHKAAAHT